MRICDCAELEHGLERQRIGERLARSLSSSSPGRADIKTAAHDQQNRCICSLIRVV